MIGLLISAAILGGIIALLERDGFPGWWNSILCVLATVIPAAIVNACLAPGLHLIGDVVGGACGTLAISRLCHSTLKRASLAVGIFLVVNLVLRLILR